MFLLQRATASYFATHHVQLVASSDHVNAYERAEEIAENIQAVLNEGRGTKEASYEVFAYRYSINSLIFCFIVYICIF